MPLCTYDKRTIAALSCAVVGSLHGHRVRFGSLSAALLQLVAGCGEMERRVQAAIDRMYTAQQPVVAHVDSLISTALHEFKVPCARSPCPSFTPLTAAEVDAAVTASGRSVAEVHAAHASSYAAEFRQRMEDCVYATQIHDHAPTCSKNKKIRGCRMAFPRGCVAATCCVQLEAHVAEGSGQRADGTPVESVRVREEGIEAMPAAVGTARDYESNPIDSGDTRLLFYEVARPAFPASVVAGIATAGDADILPPHVRARFEALSDVQRAELLVDLELRNGITVDFNPTILTALGCNCAHYLLGSRGVWRLAAVATLWMSIPSAVCLV